MYTKRKMVCAGWVCVCAWPTNYKYVVGRGGSSIFYGGNVVRRWNPGLVMKLHYIPLRTPQLSISKNRGEEEIVSELNPTKPLLPLPMDLEHLFCLKQGSSSGLGCV